MLRNRVLTLLGGCLLLGSAAFADDLGYVDCASHPEETQLFAKARKSQDVVGTVPCGERFKVVLYGFIFSEVQTADGKVGYVYSSILTIDRGGTLQTRAASPDSTPRLSAASETTKIPADPKPAQPKRAAASAPTPAPADTAGVTSAANSNSVAAQPAASPVDAPAAQVAPAPALAVQSDAAGSTNSSAAAATPAETSAPAPSPAAANSATADKLSTNNLPTPPTTQAAAEAAADAALAAASTPAGTPATGAAATPSTESAASTEVASAAASSSGAAPATEVSASAPAADASAAAPEPAAAPAPAARPQPNAAVEPGTPNPKVTRESWEKPNPGGKNTSLLEFFGGFAYARTNSGGGVSNNFIGGLGSFGVNLKPWLQITGDSSYNYYNVTGTKYVLYGNHYGPRIFWRRHNPLHKMFGITPFGEALFGGSREDVHWPASGGYTAYTTSASTFSWKVGGGIDMHASRLFEIRLIDVDYYRTSFGTGLNQSNYWVSTGIVLRLFRGWSD